MDSDKKIRPLIKNWNSVNEWISFSFGLKMNVITKQCESSQFFFCFWKSVSDIFVIWSIGSCKSFDFHHFDESFQHKKKIRWRVFLFFFLIKNKSSSKMFYVNPVVVLQKYLRKIHLFLHIFLRRMQEGHIFRGFFCAMTFEKVIKTCHKNLDWIILTNKQNFLHWQWQ